MRLLEVLCHSPSSWQGHVQSCGRWLEIQLPPSFREWRQAPGETRGATKTWRCPQPSGIFSWPAVAQVGWGPCQDHGNALSVLEERCRARCPHALRSQWQRHRGTGCKDVARRAGTFPGALEHPVVSCQAREGFLPQGRSGQGLLPLLEAPEADQGRRTEGVRQWWSPW